MKEGAKQANTARSDTRAIRRDDLRSPARLECLSAAARRWRRPSLSESVEVGQKTLTPPRRMRGGPLNCVLGDRLCLPRQKGAWQEGGGERVFGFASRQRTHSVLKTGRERREGGMQTIEKKERVRWGRLPAESFEGEKTKVQKDSSWMKGEGGWKGVEWDHSKGRGEGMEGRAGVEGLGGD